jgi:hypothetical protein
MVGVFRGLMIELIILLMNNKKIRLRIGSAFS